MNFLPSLARTNLAAVPPHHIAPTVVPAEPTAGASAFSWLRSGAEGIAAVLRSIAEAQKSVRLEIYTFAADRVGQRVRDALLTARARGVGVQVIVDALGSYDLPDDFFAPLHEAGGETRWFNPPKRFNFGTRDHRKLFVFDDQHAIVGGFNLADNYDGDGITHGWRDLGLEIRDASLAYRLAASFDAFFERAGKQLRPFQALRRSPLKKTSLKAELGKLLFGGPGLGPPSLKISLRQDLLGLRVPAAGSATERPQVSIATPYFLPTFRLFRALQNAARAGCRVRIVLPAKSDVRLSRLAAQRLYGRLLRAGVEIYEYQPQVLHMKLTLIGDAAYVGSANLDPRSLNLNYELLLRVTDPLTVAAGREIFESVLMDSRRIERKAWSRHRTWWQRCQESWAFFLLARVDPYLVRLRERWLG